MNRGFKFDSSGMIIQTGNMTLPGIFQDVDEKYDPGVGGPDSAASQSKAKYIAGGRRLYEAFFCHACVGKAYLMNDDDSLGNSNSNPNDLASLNTHKLLQDLP